MTRLAFSEEKGATLIIWIQLGFIDLPIQINEQYWCKFMLPKLKQFFETIVVTEMLTGHLNHAGVITSTALCVSSNFFK
jgi:hypothetical protein